MPGGCPRVQVSPKGNRGAQRSQGAPGLRGPPSLRGWYGGMALPGSTARLGLADRVGGTWGSTLGGIPRSTPQQEASCPRSVPTPPKAPAPTPALSMGKLRHGALPCLCPPNPHGLGGPPPSGGGGVALRGGLEEEPCIYWGPGDKLGTPGWRPLGCITTGGAMHPWVCPSVTCCQVAWDTLGQEGGGGLRAPQGPGEGILGGLGKGPFWLPLPLQAGRRFCNLASSLGSIKRAAEGRGARRRHGGGCR